MAALVGAAAGRKGFFFKGFGFFGNGMTAR
jgi:hypothetical protein